MSDWTEDRIESLKAMWAAGDSCSQIARALGGVTRNAVIGKVTRLGLTSRAPRMARSTPLPVRAPRVVAAAPLVEEDPLRLEDGNFATALTVTNRMCRWPIGDPSAPDFHFCGHAPWPESPYCRAHHAKAHEGVPTAAKRAAKAADYGQTRIMRRAGLG